MQNSDFVVTMNSTHNNPATPRPTGLMVMKYLYASAFILMSFHVPAAANSSLNDFVNLFDEYCYSFKEKPSETHAYLAKMGYKINPEYDAYEILIDDIDYAITPQAGDCTTDVLLKHKQGTLFSLDQIVVLLSKQFKLTEINSRSFNDVALNNQNTLIQQRDYKDSEGHNYRLLYPSNNQDSYYMTFTIEWLES